MAFDVSALSAYSREDESKFIVASTLKGKTASLISDKGNVWTGIKSSEKIGILATDAVFQDGSTCGFNASGTTTATQRTLTVGKIKVNEALCPIELEPKYLQKALSAGSQYDSISFANWYTDLKIAKIQEAVETAIWQGDTASGNANLSKFDGLAKIIGAAGTVVDANTATYFTGAPATTLTTSNVVAIFDAVYSAIPAKVVAADDVVIFCGVDTFRTYTIALKNANLFHYSLDIKADSEFFLPGTSVKVVAVHGLNGTKDLYAMRLSNMHLGVDMLNEEEQFKFAYSEVDDQLRFTARFKMGVQIGLPDEVVKFVIA